MLRSISSTTLYSVLLLSALAAAVNLDCSHIRIDKKKWDLSKIGGPHSILVQDTYAHPSKSNTTWTIDICQALEKPKGVSKEDSCPSYTRVCGITQTWNPIDDPEVEHPIISDVIGVAGAYDLAHGAPLDPTITRLKTSNKNVEGIDIELHGGRHNDLKQKAVVSFICDADWSGNEGAEKGKKRSLISSAKAEDEDENDGGDDDQDPKERYKQDPKNALQFVSFQEEGEGSSRMGVLRLDWKTKYACEDADQLPDDDEDEPKKAGWGFFTWFILILFLGIAAYLIFGSWLNYNRYGARGWDLLPHGDTIRDIPYLFKDWSRSVVNTVTGSSNRGGYSAV